MNSVQANRVRLVMLAMVCNVVSVSFSFFLQFLCKEFFLACSPFSFFLAWEDVSEVPGGLQWQWQELVIVWLGESGIAGGQK